MVAGTAIVAQPSTASAAEPDPIAGYVAQVTGSNILASTAACSSCTPRGQNAPRDAAYYRVRGPANNRLSWQACSPRIGETTSLSLRSSLLAASLNDTPIATGVDASVARAWNTTTVPTALHDAYPARCRRTRFSSPSRSGRYTAPNVVILDHAGEGRCCSTCRYPQCLFTKVEFRATVGSLNYMRVGRSDATVAGFFNTDRRAGSTASRGASTLRNSGEPGHLDRRPHCAGDGRHRPVGRQHGGVEQRRPRRVGERCQRCVEGGVPRSGGTFNNTVIGQAGLTYYGWILVWNTVSVPNGTYTIRSVATDRAGNVGTQRAPHDPGPALRHCAVEWCTAVGSPPLTSRG